MIAQMAKSALAVLLAGLCFGAGLPALFTVGIALWSRATLPPGPDGTARRNDVAPRPRTRVAGRGVRSESWSTRSAISTARGGGGCSRSWRVASSSARAPRGATSSAAAEPSGDLSWCGEAFIATAPS